MTQNKQGMRYIPRLRFPEFQNAPAWEEKKLGEVADVRDGTHESPKYQTTGFPLLTSKNFKNGAVDLSTAQLISKEDFDNINKRSSVDIDDIVMPMIGTIGNPVLIKETPCFAIKNVALIKTHGKVLSKYIYFLLESHIFQNHIKSFGRGGTQQFLSLKDIREFSPLFPSFSEQKKIADCLSSLDELIEATGQKAEQLKKYKKGLMQKLFPKEGETKPHLRFPEFQNATAWEEKKLGEILTIGNGRDYQHLKKGNVPVYGSGGYMLSVNDYLHEGESVCIGRKGTIDKPIFLTGKFWTVDTLFYTHSFKDCLPKFIYNSFLRIDWLKYNIASALPSLSKETINKISIPLPSLPEQKKIEECLFFLNERIEAISQKVETLKNYKKGLMQKLFPEY